MSQKNSRFIFLIALILTQLPFLLGFLLQDGQHTYTGLLLNPSDGFSYLAKMQIGLRGEWVFHLPYTAQEGQGAFIFLFYIFLGHIAQIFHLQPILVFHIARFVAVVIFLLGLEKYLRAIKVEWLRVVYPSLLFVILFGSGLGWVAGLLGLFTMDFWVAEAYPFLSMIAYPHFPLGIGILLFFLARMQSATDQVRWYDPLSGVLLSIVLPFGVVVGVTVIGFYTVFQLIQKRSIKWRLPLSFLFPAGIVLVYQYVAIISDPLLSQWNAQNQTPTPSLWIVLLSFAPLILFALIGLVYWAFKNCEPDLTLTAAWFISGIGLAYIPFALQRRFLLGWFIPVTIFAIIGLGKLVKFDLSKFRLLAWIIFPLSMLTNLFLLLGAWQAFIQNQPPLYLNQSQKAILEWMEQEFCPIRPVILATEEMGIIIPAYTDCRVVYGHPFETVRAEEVQKNIERIYDGDMNAEEINQFIDSFQVDYLIWERDNRNHVSRMIQLLPIVYQNDQFILYQTR